MCDKSLCDSSSYELLIDFNSPLQRQLEPTKCGHLEPLVPSPLDLTDCAKDVSCDQVIIDVENMESDVQNNPFDLVIHQTNLNIRMLNDPFELVYHKAYYLPTDASAEVKCKNLSSNSSSEVTDTGLKEATEIYDNIPVSVLKNNSNVVSDKYVRNSLHMNVEKPSQHFSGSISEHNLEDSLICIEDVTDPTGHMFLSLSDNSDAFKQSSATEQETPLNNMNTNTKSGRIPQTENLVDESSSLKSSSSEENLSSKEIANNSKCHTDEELKAIVASRITTCIQNALEQSKLCTKENCVLNCESVVQPSLTTPDKIIAVNSYSTHKHSHSFISPAIKKALTTSVNESTPLEEILWQKGKTNSVDINLKTRLDKLKFQTKGRDYSAGSVDSYGEFNKAFYSVTLSQSSNSPRDRLGDRSFSNFTGKSAVKHLSIPCNINKFASPKSTNISEAKKELLCHSKLQENKYSTCEPSNEDGNVQYRSSLSVCLDSSDNGNVEHEGDDSVFMEANTLAFVFNKIADSFTQETYSDEEDDILGCKPQWEASELKLPKFSSEEDDTEEAENNNVEHTSTIDKAAANKVISVPRRNNTSKSQENKPKSSSSKKEMEGKNEDRNSNSSSSSFSSPLSEQGIRDLSLQTRLTFSVDNKLSRVVPNGILLPPPLNLIDEEGESDMKLKPKRKQQIEKRGPVKAIVPLDNMTRPSGFEKKGIQPQTPLRRTTSAAVFTSTPKPLVRSLSSQEIVSNSTQIVPLKPCQKKAVVNASHELRTGAMKKDSSQINRSFTSSTPSSVPTLRRANSLTGGIPSLAKPSVTLSDQFSTNNNIALPSKNKEYSTPFISVQPPSPVHKNQPCQIPNHDTEKKSKFSSSIPQFNISGLIVTSTPTRKNSHTSPIRSTPKCLPSPISVKNVKSKSLLRNEVSVKTKVVHVPKNKSLDGMQQKEKSKLISRHHERSKSVSNIQPKDERPTLLSTENRCNKPKIQFSSDKCSTFDNSVRKDHSKSPDFQMGILKPLMTKNINQRCLAKDLAKMELTSISTTDQKRSKPIKQLFSKLKINALRPVDKENVKPT